jgi:hypothetical protein
MATVQQKFARLIILTVLEFYDVECDVSFHRYFGLPFL